MADGTIRTRWLAPLPVVVAADAEPEHLPGQHPPVALVEVVELQLRPAEAAGVLEAAAEAEVVQQQRRQHRRIFSAPSRICFMSRI